MTWQPRIAKKAERNLKRLPRRDRERVIEALTQLTNDPYAMHGVQTLRAHPVSFRLRVGDYRVLYNLNPEQQIVDVIDISRRTTTTYRGRSL